MNITQHLRLCTAAILVALLTGCATAPSFDYSAFKESKPKSILVLPPLNNSPDVAATNSVLAQATAPLAEVGYYVMPVTLVNETFHENGLTQPADMHATSIEKLREIFGADAALYLTVTKYGTSYKVVDSETLVSIDAKLADLRTGTVLWTGSASASSAEQNQQNQGGLIGLLVTAIVKQVIASSTNQSHPMAGVATNRLLMHKPNGLLYGPRSPEYGKD